MLEYGFTNQFKKDLKLMEKRHKDMNKIVDIMALIIYEEIIVRNIFFPVSGKGIGSVILNRIGF